MPNEDYSLKKQFVETFGRDGDVMYVVERGASSCRVHACRAIPTEIDIDWTESVKLNKLCAGRTACRVTVCCREKSGQEEGDSGWLVDKQGVWRVYGSPFDLTGNIIGNNHDTAPVSTYPRVNFNLVDLDGSGEVEIVVSEGDLLCIELFKLLDDNTSSSSSSNNPISEHYGRYKQGRFDPFNPVNAAILFQGSISFDALRGALVSKQQLLSTTTNTDWMLLSMSGPGGEGEVKVIVGGGRRLSVIDRLLRKYPSRLSVRLLSLSIGG
jgi:hypothetical protein